MYIMPGLLLLLIISLVVHGRLLGEAQGALQRGVVVLLMLLHAGVVLLAFLASTDPDGLGFKRVVHCSVAYTL